MKKVLCVLLCGAMILGLVAGCAKKPKTAAETLLEEGEPLKIMILGSSRSLNTFRLLYEVFRDQMPEQDVTLGVMYYSSCSMSMHKDFIENNQSVYDYHINDSGKWVIHKKVNMERGLKDQDWDVILMQPGNGDLENRMNEPCRTFIKNYVDSVVENPHQFWWHGTWFNSTDPSLYDPAKTTLDPATVDQYAHLTNSIEATKAYVMDDPMFSGHITSGTPMMYALKVLGIPETDLFRDHTHLKDLGFLVVAYAWYAQFTGRPVTEIGLDAIPVHLRRTEHQSLGEFEITDQMKEWIIKTVDYTLNNPWSVPVKE